MGTRVVMSTWMRGQGVSTLCWACAFGVQCSVHPAPTEGAVLPAGPHTEVRTDQQPQQSGPDKPKVTTRFMTKYERARILGTRALQIRSAWLRLSSAWHGSSLRGGPLLSLLPATATPYAGLMVPLQHLTWLAVCAAA